MSKFKISRRKFLSTAGKSAGLVAVAGGVAFSGCNPKLNPPVEKFGREPGDDLDQTFYVIADTHLGYKNSVEKNKDLACQLNSLHQYAKIPFDIHKENLSPIEHGFEDISTPAAVIIAGDLTEDGKREQWKDFEKIFGLTGNDGMLNYPVLECTGNHDRRLFGGGGVPKVVAKRHGGVCYRKSFGDLQVISVDTCPGDENLGWLKKELRKVGTNLPVILFFHYNIDGPFSQFWSLSEKQKFARACANYNIIGIFHGHYHPPQMGKFNNMNVFNTGASKHGCNSLMVCRVTSQRIGVCTYFWGRAENASKSCWHSNLTRVQNWRTGEIII